MGDVLSVAPQNRLRGGNDVRHASRSSGLLDVEVSLTRIFQSDLNTAGCTTMSDARDTIAEVVSEAS